MSDTELYKIPTVELSAKFLLSLSQLIIFLVITYWVSQGTENNIDYLLPMLMVGAALSLFLSVPNARMGVTLGIPLLMVVWGLATGENDMMFFAIFMLLLIGPIAYLPAMATGDSTLDLDDETRIKRLGILWLAFTVFMLFMMAPVVDMAMEGEWAEESPDGKTYDMSIDSTSQTIAMGALGLGIAGILVFLMTAVMGMELGPMRPFHGGAMAASTMIIAQYLVLMADGGPAFNIADMPFIIALVGLIGLPPYIAYESDGNEEVPSSEPSEKASSSMDVAEEESEDEAADDTSDAEEESEDSSDDDEEPDAEDGDEENIHSSAQGGFG